MDARAVIATKAKPQSCTSCWRLEADRPLATAAELREHLALLEPQVDAGRLVQIAGDSTFADLKKGLCEDWVYQRFVCTRCSREYELSVESFDGGGGSWRLRPVPLSTRVS
jgi:hypothetical protein